MLIVSVRDSCSWCPYRDAVMLIVSVCDSGS